MFPTLLTLLAVGCLVICIACHAWRKFRFGTMPEKDLAEAVAYAAAGQCAASFLVAACLLFSGLGFVLAFPDDGGWSFTAIGFAIVAAFATQQGFHHRAVVAHVADHVIEPRGLRAFPSLNILSWLACLSPPAAGVLILIVLTSG